MPEADLGKFANSERGTGASLLVTALCGIFQDVLKMGY